MISTQYVVYHNDNEAVFSSAQEIINQEKVELRKLDIYFRWRWMGKAADEDNLSPYQRVECQNPSFR